MAEAEILEPESKMGRPSEYSDEVFTEICERMAEGKSVREICADPDMPSRRTFLRWIEKDTGRQQQYQRAREALMDWYSDEILRIAFDNSGDTTTETDGSKVKTVANHAAVQRDRLKVDTIKFLMAKLHPKRYGDKTELLVAASGPQEPASTGISWAPSVRVIVHQALRDDGSLIPKDTAEYDEAIRKAVGEARAKGATSVRLGYDLAPGANASVADLMREVDGRTRTTDPRDRPTEAPSRPPQITYQPAQPPADLSPEAWARISRVSELIEQIAPSDEMPEAVFGFLEGALRKHYLGASNVD